MTHLLHQSNKELHKINRFDRLSIMITARTDTLLFGLLAFAYCIYAAIFIYQSSLVIEGVRYFGLFDDAMISMRYARNLASGAGLVWNTGDVPVEGFTNLLWTVYMAVFHLLPFSSETMSLPIQISGVVFLLLNLVFVKKITDELSGSRLMSLLVVFLVAFYYPLNQWGLLGMEVSVLTLLATMAAWMVVRSVKSGAFSFWPYVLLGISTLIRMDMLVLGMATWVFFIWFDDQNRRLHLVWGAVFLTGPMLGQTLWRWWYYGDLLPNTYYLKMAGSPLLYRIMRGAFVFVKFSWNMNPVLFLIPLIILLFRRDKPVWYLLVAFGSMAAYSIYVGGDAWEHRGGSNRFFSVVIPLYFILFGLASEKIFQGIAGQMVKGVGLFHEKWGTRLMNVILIGYFFLSSINFNAMLDTLSLRYAALLTPTVHVVGEEKYIRIARFINEITTEEARVAVVAAGAISYFSPRPSIDLLGKSDAFVARDEMRIDPTARLIDFRPGHNKWNYDHSIGVLQPDIIPEIWQYTEMEFLPFRDQYSCIHLDEFERWLAKGIMYVRTGSPNIYWDEIQPYLLESCP
jgi:hypothetical protein